MHIKFVPMLIEREGLARFMQLTWAKIAGMFFAKRSFFILQRELIDDPEPMIAGEVEVVFAGEADYEALGRLMYISSDSVYELIQRGNMCAVAKIRGELAGYSWIFFEPYHIGDIDYVVHVGDKEAYIGPDYVHPAFRGKRIHGALMSHNFRFLRHKGFTRALGSVNVKNFASIKGVKRVGYRADRIATMVKIGPARHTRVEALDSGFEMPTQPRLS